jgi:hypothetical protein
MVDAERTLAAARRLEVAMTAGLGLLAAFGLLGVAISVAAPISGGRGCWCVKGSYGENTLSAGQAWVVIGVVAIHVGFWIALLDLAGGVFRQLSRGNPKAAARRARVLALLLWGMLAWGLVSQMITSAAATWGFPVGERTISIAFGTTQISVAFAALIASFLAHGFALGAELWQDHWEVI